MVVLILRVILLVVCSLSLLILCNRYRLNRAEWTQKTRDYWYAQTMWSVAGIAIPVEGIARGTAWRYSFVFIMAAAIVNLIGLRRKGPWGTNNVR
jgi:hypothetical protein